MISLAICYSMQPNTLPFELVLPETYAQDQQQIYQVLQEAQLELYQRYNWPISTPITITVHASLESFQAATGAPWFIAAQADRDQMRIDMQRLTILKERGILVSTLRHELFHLLQPEGWSRWRAEGAAMHFAKERPKARPFRNISEQTLEQVLGHPTSQQELARAMATVWLWVQREGLQGF